MSLEKFDTTVHGKQMLNYYPEIIKDILDYQALMLTEGIEFDNIHTDFNSAFDDAYFSTMSESRISEWEKVLGITPFSTDTLEDRRSDIKSKFIGDKLNTASIANVVKAYTNGTATSYFKDGVVTVEIKPPPENKDFKFSAVENEIKKRLPAHLGLNVIRDYATWGELKTNFDSWADVAEADNWEKIKAYITPTQTNI